MNTLVVLEGLIAGVWLGAYLFTTLVVSPALKQLPLKDAERIRTRSVIGRRYGKLAIPLLFLWVLVLLLQDFGPTIALRLTLLFALIVASGLHAYVLGARMQQLADAEVATGKDRVEARSSLTRQSAYLTFTALGLSLALAVLALIQPG